MVKANNALGGLGLIVVLICCCCILSSVSSSISSARAAQSVTQLVEGVECTPADGRLQSGAATYKIDTNSKCIPSATFIST